MNNKNKDMEELRDKVLIPGRGDGFNHYRRIYNGIIEEKILEGRQGIQQERYLTVTLNAGTLRRQRHSLPRWRRRSIRRFLSLGQRSCRFAAMKG